MIFREWGFHCVQSPYSVGEILYCADPLYKTVWDALIVYAPPIGSTGDLASAGQWVLCWFVMNPCDSPLPLLSSTQELQFVVAFFPVFRTDCV